jgi:hypothetical protein
MNNLLTKTDYNHNYIVLEKDGIHTMIDTESGEQIKPTKEDIEKISEITGSASYKKLLAQFKNYGRSEPAIIETDEYRIVLKEGTITPKDKTWTLNRSQKNGTVLQYLNNDADVVAICDLLERELKC